MIRCGNMCCVAQLVCLASIPALAQNGENVQRSVRDGIAVEFSAARIGLPAGIPYEIREGDDLQLRLKLYDSATRKPVSGVRLSAWIDTRDQGTGASCAQQAAKYLSGGLLGQSKFDLNTFLVLSLNADASISVYDPRFDTARSRLIARVGLSSPGEDWALSPDESALFVSMPEAGAVAMIDTATWNAVADITTGPRPGRLLLQPDADTIWVAGADGISAISTAKGKVAEHFQFTAGIRDITASADGRYIFVAAANSSSVSVIDTGLLATVREIRDAGSPVSMDFSSQSQLAYAVDGEGSRIVALRATGNKPVAEIPVDAGVSYLRFTPDGRYAFALNPIKNRVYIIDAATNRIRKDFKVDKAPERVSFSSKMAYIQLRDSEIVVMVPLDGIADPGKPVPVTDLPGGQFPVVSDAYPTQANRIVPTPGRDSVLLANARDRSLYLYKEGTFAPMGAIAEASMPKAAMILNAAIRERKVAGTYETTFRAGSAGKYTVTAYVEDPRMTQCFDLAVSPKSDSAATERVRFAVEPGAFRKEGPAAEEFVVRFRVRDSSGKLAAGVGDISVQVAAAAGNWFARRLAGPTDDGVYEAGFQLPQPGVYYVTLESRSLGFAYYDSFRMVYRAL